MKKVLAFALSVSIFGAVAAQPDYRNGNYKNDNHRYEAPKQDDHRWDDKRTAPVYNPQNNRPDNRFDQHDNRRMSDQERRQEMDRINRDYDRQIVAYRNNRSMNDRDRNNRIQVLEKEKNNKIKAFGGGLILGGILGAILSN